MVARYSDGTTRDVTRLALYLTNNKNTADIDEQGMVTASKRGDAFVFARFAKYTVGAEMIVLPNDKHFRWPKIPANNYIDELVDAKLQKLRIVPSAASSAISSAESPASSGCSASSVVSWKSIAPPWRYTT